MYDMTRGVLPLKLLDLINHKYVQNANIYAANRDLGFHPVNTISSFHGKSSRLYMEKQNASLGGDGCLNQPQQCLKLHFHDPTRMPSVLSGTEVALLRLWAISDMPVLP
jgi:hypothetical protein